MCLSHEINKQIFQAVMNYQERFFVFAVGLLWSFVCGGVTQIQKHTRWNKFKKQVNIGCKDGRRLLQTVNGDRTKVTPIFT